MQDSFHNKRLFRFFAPIIFGFIAYVLILLIFDTINELNENFFSAEVLLTIIIAYLIAGANRVLINSLSKRFAKSQKLLKYMAVQMSLTSAATLFITSLIISVYMRYLVGFKSFNTELIVFNSIYLVLSLSYNLMYFSIFYSKKMNEIQLLQAQKAKKESEIELEAYKSKMNPDLLNKSLETLICHAAKNPETADNYISQISDFYRSILNSKRTELIDLENEIETARNYIALQNSWNNDNIHLSFNVDESAKNKKIIPGSLYVFMEQVINNSIVSPIIPLEISCKANRNKLIMECFKRDRIKKESSNSFETEQLLKAYAFYSDTKPEIYDEAETITIKMPLFELTKIKK